MNPGKRADTHIRLHTTMHQISFIRERIVNIMEPLSYMRSVVDRNVVTWGVPVFSDSFVAFQMPVLYDVHVRSAVM